MEKELNIKQKIFAEFIKLELIDQAIEYAKNADLSENEQKEALQNKKRKLETPMKKILEKFENVEIFKNEYILKIKNDTLFLHSEIDQDFHYEVKKINENAVEIIAFSNNEFDQYNSYLSKITIDVENITNEFFDQIFEV